MDAARRHRTYWRDTPDNLFTVRVTPDGGFIYDGFNPSTEIRTGLKNADIVGRRPEEVLGPDGASALIARYRQCVETGGPITYSATLSFPTGRRHWETSLVPVRGDDGEISLLMGSAHDITARVELQEVIARGEERFRRLTNLIPEILFTISAENGPDYFSERFYEYTGLPKALVGPAITGVLHPDDAHLLHFDVDEADPSEVLQAEVRLRRHDGVYRWFLVRVSIVENARGRRRCGVAADIDDVKRAGEQISSLNERLTSVLSSISDCYYTLDRDWRVTSANDRAAEWFGLPHSALVGQDLRDLQLAKSDIDQAIRHAFETGRPLHLERRSDVRPERWIEYHVYPSAEGVSIFFRDITERRRAQAEIEEVTGLLQGSLDAMSAQIALLDDTGRVVAVNDAWREATVGQNLFQAGLGAPYLDLCRRLTPELDEAKVARGMRALLAGRQKTFSQAYVLTTPEGVRWRHLRINRFLHGLATRLIVVHEDVTEVVRAQTALREVSESLLNVQEEERRRIAVDLHDSTSQHLVAIGLGVARLRRSVETTVGAVLDDMAGSIAEALKEIRVLSYLLNPPNLERDGLEATARRFVGGFGARTGLHTMFRVEGELDHIDPALQHAAFRVIQEALSNVHRHAGANGAEVDLAVRGRNLVLRIADDGHGIGDFDLGLEGGVQLGVGIPGMQARAAQLGGTLTVASDGAGAVVEAILPLSYPPALLAG